MLFLQNSLIHYKTELEKSTLNAKVSVTLMCSKLKHLIAESRLIANAISNHVCAFNFENVR